jgi:mono/diheme cytochrome c family protein
VRGGGLAVILASGVLLTACGQDEKPAPSAGPSGSASSPGAAASMAAAGDPTKGRQILLGQCVACHNPDPGKDGPIGPAVKGASKELLDARVVHGTYPPGYKPKRETKVMPPRPDLVASIPDLAAYLR